METSRDWFAPEGQEILRDEYPYPHAFFGVREFDFWGVSRHLRYISVVTRQDWIDATESGKCVHFLPGQRRTYLSLPFCHGLQEVWNAGRYSAIPFALVYQKRATSLTTTEPRIVTLQGRVNPGPDPYGAAAGRIRLGLAYEERCNWPTTGDCLVTELD